MASTFVLENEGQVNLHETLLICCCRKILKMALSYGYHPPINKQLYSDEKEAAPAYAAWYTIGCPILNVGFLHCRFTVVSKAFVQPFDYRYCCRDALRQQLASASA